MARAAYWALEEGQKSEELMADSLFQAATVAMTASSWFAELMLEEPDELPGEISIDFFEPSSRS